MKHGALTTLRYSTLWPQHSLWSSSSKSCLLVRSGVASRHLTFIFRGHKPINKIKNTVRQRSPSSEHQIREFLSEEWCSSPESIFRVLDLCQGARKLFLHFMLAFPFICPLSVLCGVTHTHTHTHCCTHTNAMILESCSRHSVRLLVLTCQSETHTAPSIMLSSVRGAHTV